VTHILCACAARVYVRLDLLKPEAVLRVSGEVAEKSPHFGEGSLELNANSVA
jgi:hypothetical protein